MRYHSQASGREKDYVVHPYRLVHAQGGLYLMAFVPAYAELRTFAVERIRRAALEQQSFEPVTELESDPFRHSLGAYRGVTSQSAAPLPPANRAVYQGALVAFVATVEGPARRFRRDDDGCVRRLRASELDPELRPLGASHCAGEPGRVAARGTGAGARAGRCRARSRGSWMWIVSRRCRLRWNDWARGEVSYPFV